MNGFHILAERLPCHYDVQFVCTKYMCYRSATYFPHFDVSLSEKLLKIVNATMRDF